MRKATLSLSDMHFGDAGQLYRTLQRAMQCATDQIRDFAPDELECLANGDAVAGRGIFRDQEMQNALQFGGEQIWWAAWWLREWTLRFQGARPRWRIIKGNHDSAKQENLAQQLVSVLRLLDVPAAYTHRAYIGNFAAEPAEDMWFEAQHGFGNSSYYANSYESIREAWRMYIEHTQRDGRCIARFLRAHTHWLNVGQVIGLGVHIDTTGGWHRQERARLAADTRNTGLLLYLHDGQKLSIVPIEADRQTLLQDTDDPSLHYETMAAAAAALREATTWAHERGLC